MKTLSIEKNNQLFSVSSRSQLIKLVDKDLLIDLLAAFTKATGLNANIVDADGMSIFSKKEAQKNCKYCQLICKLENKKGYHRCKGAYARAGKQAAIFNEPYIFRCPAGLIEWASPIIVDDMQLGSIICGQVLMWEPENFFWIEIREMNKVLTDNFEPLIQAAKELQVISAEKVHGAANLLSIISNHIVNTAWEKLQQQKELELHQSLLEDEIQTRRNLEDKLNFQSLNYYIEKEKSLIGKLKLGDFEEGRKIFKVIIADILSDDIHNILNTYKARIFELIVVISRYCSESGFDPDKAININTVFMQKLNNCKNSDEISIITNKIFDNYLNILKNTTKSKNHIAIEGMKYFIRKNSMRSLTLEEIANSVYISPYYASRIFKDDQHITIMDYCTKIKLEEAKKMLTNPRYRIQEIASNLGYLDASYFSRVFKQKEGISPSEYRLNN